MYCENACLGVDCEMEEMKTLGERLNTLAMEQVNGSQEIVMMSSFARESSEYLYKKCLQERISEVSSWRWVLSDLGKRLDESIGALQYEHNALRVVVQRIEEEINNHCREGSRPGALSPLCDSVEESIMQEYTFLRDQKRNFEKMITDVDKQRAKLQKTKKQIEEDILHKDQAISIDEAASDPSNATVKDWKKKKKKGLPMIRWEKRCAALKRAGLRALANAIITRQQVRGTRAQLSIAAQSYATRVDSTLRRRLHSNKMKLQDISWQREEVLLDYKSLADELSTTEQSLLQSMEQERVVEARLMNRASRPGKELTRDDVDRELRGERTQFKTFAKELRKNIEGIRTLQDQLADAITRLDCCAEDLIQVIRLDEDRIRSRIGEVPQDASDIGTTTRPAHSRSRPPKEHSNEDNFLTVIQEDDEDDDYPFDT